MNFYSKCYDDKSTIKWLIDKELFKEAIEYVLSAMERCTSSKIIGGPNKEQGSTPSLDLDCLLCLQHMET